MKEDARCAGDLEKVQTLEHLERTIVKFLMPMGSCAMERIYNTDIYSEKKTEHHKMTEAQWSAFTIQTEDSEF